MTRTGIYRLFPDAPGYNEDNGTLLQTIITYLPADRVQTTAAAALPLATATAGVLTLGDPDRAPACGPPLLEYTEAVYAGHLPALQWYWTNRDKRGRIVVDLAKDGADDKPSVSYTLAVKGHLECLKLAYALNCPLADNICTLAAQYNHADVLRWALERGCEWSYDTYTHAAHYGNHHILRDWTAYTWGDMMCTQAARRGDLDGLKWLRSLPQPSTWTAHTCAYAARNGHFEVLQWLRAQSPPCPWDEWAATLAARTGRRGILSWLHEHGCPIADAHVIHEAVENGYVTVLQWLHAARGLPADLRPHIHTAWVNGHYGIAHWLQGTRGVAAPAADPPPCPGADY